MPTKTKGKKKRTKAKATTYRKMTSKTKKASKKTGKVKVGTRRKVVAKAVRKKSRTRELAEFPSERVRARSGRQSGDLEGLSTVEGADSESVAELLEEGNALEAGVVAGVEAADEDGGEVQTHEVPEEDVPQEYLDED